jgi:hypothetical protein
MAPIHGPPQATHTRLTRRALKHPHKDSAAANFGQTQAPAAAAAPAQESPRNGHHDWHEAGNRSRRHGALSAKPDSPTEHARGKAEETEEDDAERANHDAEQNSQSSAIKRPLPPGDTPPRRQAPDERPSPGSAEAQANKVLRTQAPAAEGKQRTVLLSLPKPDFASKRPGAHKCPTPGGAVLSKRSEVASSCWQATERPLYEKVETTPE